MFSQVVELYQLLGCPQIDDGTFSFAGTVEQKVIAHLQAMDNLPEKFGDFIIKEIQGFEVNIEFGLPSTEHGRFYKSINDFVENTPTLEKGIVPLEFYIQDLNFYSKSQDENIPDIVKRLLRFCEFVRLISQLSSDAPDNEQLQTYNRLMFILSADGKSPAKTFTLRTRISKEIIDIDLPHVNFMRVLVAESTNRTMHAEERCMILRNSIAETLQQLDTEMDQFLYLVKNWNAVYTKYRHNFQAFLSQYSFDKARKDIASAEIDHASKLSGILGDIVGKLLALPVSLAGLVLLRNSKNNFEFWVGAVGLTTVTVIFLMVLYNQWLQVKRLRETFNFIFSQYDETLLEFPPKFRAPIEKAKQSIKNQTCVLSMTFVVFLILAMLPFIGVIYVACEQNFFDFPSSCSFVYSLIFGECLRAIL